MAAVLVIVTPHLDGGGLAERLRTGLQIREDRFDSGTHLHPERHCSLRVGAWRGDNRYTAANVSEAMYLAQTPDLAMLEATRQFQRAMSTPEFPAYTIIPVAVDFSRVLDMTREVAHAGARPMAPVSAYLLGLATGLDADADTERLRSVIEDVATAAPVPKENS